MSEINFIINPILNPFLQILVTIILCSGILNFGRITNSIIFKDYNYNFFNLAIGVIILSHIIFVSFLADILNLVLLPITICLVTLGIMNIKFFLDINSLVRKIFKDNNKIFKIIIVFFFLFFIISLAPPSMTDALDYHYGVPLNILKYSNFPNQDIWLHGSLFGYGELINIIPLNLKTDNFFSFFQLLSVVFFFEYFYRINTDKDKLFYLILFIICTPVILFLISGPKALLFPQLLTAMTLYLYIKNDKYNRRNIIIMSIFLISATQFKISFILSGAVIGLLILIKTFKNDKKNILNLIIIFCIIFFPKILYNYSQVELFNYLNFFTTTPMYILEYLSNYKDNYYFYPFNLFIPVSLGYITTILGFHLLLLFFLKEITIRFKSLIIITLFSIMLHFIFGQQTSKMYFEFILWIAVGFLFLDKKSFNKGYFNYFLFPQLIFVFISSLYFTINIFPTFFDIEKRDQFMTNNTFNYKGIKWVNKNIPSNTTIISNLRSVSLFNNKVIPNENLLILNDEYINYLKLNKPRFFVTSNKKDEIIFLKNCLGDLYKVSDELVKSKRNPFGDTFKYKIYIYFFNFENLDFCVDL